MRTDVVTRWGQHMARPEFVTGLKSVFLNFGAVEASA